MVRGQRGATESLLLLARSANVDRFPAHSYHDCRKYCNRMRCGMAGPIAVRTARVADWSEGSTRASRNQHPATLAWSLLAVLVLLFLTIPSVIVVASSFSDTNYLTFPPQGFTLRW